MRRGIRVAAVALVALLVAGVAGAVPRRHVLASGGNASSGSGRVIKSTIGQSVVGISIGGGKAAAHGFWSHGGVLPLDAPIGGLEPGSLALGMPSPNPARTRVSLELGLATSGHPRLDVHDVSGRRVGSLDPGTLAAGRHRLEWRVPVDRERVPAGVYFASVVLDGRSAGVRRFVVVR